MQGSMPRAPQGAGETTAAGGLDAADADTIAALVASHCPVTELIRDRQTTIARLRRLVFGEQSEGREVVLGKAGPVEEPLAPGSGGASPDGEAHPGEPPRARLPLDPRRRAARAVPGQQQRERLVLRQPEAVEQNAGGANAGPPVRRPAQAPSARRPSARPDLILTREFR